MEIKSEYVEAIKNPEQIAKIFQDILLSECIIDQNKEHFWVMGLNGDNTINYIELVTLGLLDQSLVHPREVFRFAILKGIKSIIVVHNHPSVNVNPSVEDIHITQRLVDVGKILGIPIIDHIIISRINYYSFKGHGKI